MLLIFNLFYDTILIDDRIMRKGSRNDSDYDDFFIVSKEEVAEQIKDAELFLVKIKEYVSTK